MRPVPDAGPEDRRIELLKTVLMSERHAPIVENTPALALHWPDETATQHWASALARHLAAWPGGRDASIELRGELGAGKTTLVRHLLRACGVQGRIKSPTYAVVEPHQGVWGGQPWPIWHFDFYRFSDPREWEDAGFRDIFAGPGLKLMEWPDKVAGQLPPPDWVIAIEAMDENERRVQVQASTVRGAQWLQHAHAAQDAAWLEGPRAL
jgi:tRNA threonylcarbamoyladenosine biosynthesis protein TsaE